MAKQKRETFITPIAEALWAHVIKPDTKFNKEGVWRIKLLLSPEEAAEFTQKIDEQMEVAKGLAMEALEGMKPAARKKAEERMAEEMPYEEHYDDEGDDTGLLAFKLKANTSYTDKKGVKRDITITIVDRKGTEIKGPKREQLIIWNGSRVRCEGYFFPYYNSSTGNYGVALKLTAVQVVSLAATSGRSGLGEVDEGDFDADDMDDSYYSDDGDTPAADDGANGDF